MAEKIRTLVLVIRENLFNPDQPCLRRWNNCKDYEDALKKQKREAKAMKRSNQEHMDDLLRSSSSEGSESSESAIDSSDSEKEKAQASVGALKNVKESAHDDGFLYFRHLTRNTVHRTKKESDEDVSVCLCGRLPSKHHIKLMSRPRVVLQGCDACFRCA